MSFGLEVDMIRAAVARDLLAVPYVLNEDEARAMASADADIIVAHVGLTSSGAIGAKTVLSLDDAVKTIKKIRDAAVSVKPDVLVLCHGGPVAGPADARYVLDRTEGIMASSAPRRWSGCRPGWRSPTGSRRSSTSERPDEHAPRLQQPGVSRLGLAPHRQRRPQVAMGMMVAGAARPAAG